MVGLVGEEVVAVDQGGGESGVSGARVILERDLPYSTSVDGPTVPFPRQRQTTLDGTLFGGRVFDDDHRLGGGAGGRWGD